MKNFFALLKRHKILSGLGIILLIVIGYYSYNKTHAAQATVRYLTAAVQSGTITSSVSGTGQVAASQNVDIDAQSSGKVTSVNIKQGDTVKAGQTLITLDESTAQNQINSAKASVDSAQANYDKVLAGALTTDIQSAQLSVDSAQQSLANAKSNYTQVVSQQALSVAKAFSSFLNDNLEAVPSDNGSTATVTLSGSYTSTTEGSYTVTIYTAGDGLHYSVSGLGSAAGPINRGLAQSIGNGLYITFSSTGTISAGTSWAINVPNVQSASYVSDQNSYNSAIQSQQQAVQQAQQQIDSTQNSLEQAQLQLTTKQEPPAAADVETAKVQIETAQASLQSAETTYSNNIIRAPFDGVITKVDVSNGQQASGVVASEITHQNIAQVTLNEVDAAKVQAGQKATLSFSAIPNYSLTGTVAQVDSVGTVSQNVVNFTVQIAFDAQSDQVKPGMSVSADIITQVKQDVLMVPSAAVKTTGGQSYVQILVNGQPQPVNVTTGISSDTDTEVSGQLQAGQEVVTQTITSTAAKAPTTATTGSIIPGLGGGGAVRFGGGARAGN